jgi:tRNA-specific adenosine deaminase 3
MEEREHGTGAWIGFVLLASLCSIRVQSPGFTGSLFNHSDFPNLSYIIDSSTDSIRYTTSRAVEPDEELCIYYGSNLWFKGAESDLGASELSSKDQETDDGWGGLSNVDVLPDSGPIFFEGSGDMIVPEQELPFERFKPPPDEETADTIRTGKS